MDRKDRKGRHRGRGSGKHLERQLLEANAVEANSERWVEMGSHSNQKESQRQSDPVTERKRLLDRYVQLNVSRTGLAETSDTSVQREKRDRGKP